MFLRNDIFLGREQFDMCEEVSDALIFFGKVQKGDPQQCLIERLEKIDGVWCRMYPDGFCNQRNKDWAKRNEYTYQLAKDK